MPENLQRLPFKWVVRMGDGHPFREVLTVGSVVVSFDRVNHDKLMARIAQQISDKRMLKLIRALLTAGVTAGSGAARR